MIEAAGLFPELALDRFDTPGSDNYPHAAVLEIGAAQLVMVGTLHFTNPSPTIRHGYQAESLQTILTHTIGPRSESEWIVLTEGNAVKRRQLIHTDMSFMEALAAEHEMGMLILQAKQQGQLVGRWDLLMGQEMKIFLRMYSDPANPLSNKLRQLWGSPAQLAQWLYYHEYGKASYQYLRHQDEGTPVGGHREYVSRILEAHGVDKVVAQYDIDTSDKALKAIHNAVCQEAGLKEPLPLDPLEALTQGLSWGAYAALHFTQASPPDGQPADISRLREIGDTASTALRNTHLAAVAMRCLAAPNPKNVLLFAGGSPPGRHVITAVHALHEKGVPMDTLRWHIGATACQAAFAASKR